MEIVLPVALANTRSATMSLRLYTLWFAKALFGHSEKEGFGAVRGEFCYPDLLLSSQEEGQAEEKTYAAHLPPATGNLGFSESSTVWMNPICSGSFCLWYLSPVEKYWLRNIQGPGLELTPSSHIQISPPFFWNA